MSRLRRYLLLLCWAIGWLPAIALAAAEPRLALVTGNAAYKSSPLANPVNDARLMEVALKEAGFTVLKAENASIREMRRLVRDFGDRLKSSGGVGLFYFAGHGVQVRGENFLVSTDSDIRNEDEVADDSVNANVVLEKMQGAGNRMNIIILDACRDNPFVNKSRSAASGLATLSAPSGSLVAYATAPGSVASDGRGNNGLYTQHLANAIRQTGLPIEEVFKQVRAAVRRDSSNQQTPWENTALEGQFFFREPVALTAPVVPPVTPPTLAIARPAPLEASVIELAFWDSIKASQRIAELEAYLSQFPAGTFAPLARVRLNDLKSAATVSREADRLAVQARADVQAVARYRNAADAGDAAGMANLASMYREGRGGLAKDDVQAVAWYRKAADAGNSTGMNNIGFMYREGRGGLVKDGVQAVAWTRKAADAGDTTAMSDWGFMYSQGLGGLAKDDVQAVAWYRKSADAGNGRGMSNLGFMYREGRGGLTKDDVQAVAWFRKAVEAGNALGMSNLGFMYRNGRGGLAKDDVQAVAWFRKAADAGDAPAMNSLGFFYESGFGGLTKDTVVARHWYQRAADLGNELAKANLAKLP